jgi:vacuolar protein sorting-associated protein 13A/C
MTLTQSQYRLVMALLRDLPTMLSTNEDIAGSPSTKALETDTAQGTVSANSSAEDVSSASTMDVKFDVPTIRLELFDAKAVSKAKLKGHSIIRFEIEDVATLYQKQANGEQLADLRLGAITLSNTRPGTSLYRDFLPKSTGKEAQM